MGKPLNLIFIFILAQLLFACSTTDTPQYYKAEVKERKIWQTVAEVQPQQVSGINFKNGRLVNNYWVIDLFQNVDLKQKRLAQRIEYFGKEKPVTLDLVIEETQCTFSNADCEDTSIEWHEVPGEENVVGFTDTLQTQSIPYQQHLGKIAAKLQVKQNQNIVTVPVQWEIKKQKIFVDLKPALEQAPFKPEKAVLNVEFSNEHHSFSHKVVFDDYIFNFLDLASENWNKPDVQIQPWLNEIARCLPEGNIDCALTYMLKIEESGEALPDTYYYHLASMLLMAGDSERARIYAKKYLALPNSQQYRHQARAML